MRPVNLLDRRDPYRKFKFIIRFEDRTVAACRKMSGLTASVETIKFRDEHVPREGGAVLPGAASFEPVTLESGLSRDLGFVKWANAPNAADPRFRRTVAIDIKDIVNRSVVRTFTLHNAWVSKFTSLSDLVADGNEVLIESVQIEHEGFTQEP